MHIKREITPYLKQLATQFPAVAIMGPRQSGKTTLARHTFPDYAYVSLEDIDRRLAAKEDPRSFFATYANQKGLIIDEIQEVPELLSYMQGIIDEKNRPGFFIVTGSQHFLIYEKITQTLAGRIALLTLLPLSISELAAAQLLSENPEPLMIKSCYPRVYAQQIDPALWISNYISTYVERDVRQVLNISDVATFQRFLKLCAARVGNIINYAELARDADISPNTAKSWLSVLEASFIITLLQPYHKNFNKRVIKSPKLYFYDVALICALLGIKTAEELLLSPLRGALFESFVISEFLKYSYNHNKRPNLFFWRDSQGHEIDCIIEKMYDTTLPIEIKANKTPSSDFFKNLIKWENITEQEALHSYVVYSGNETLIRKSGTIIAWNKITAMLDEIYAQ